MRGTPAESGDFNLGIRCEGFGRLRVSNKQVATAFGGGGLSSGVGRVHLEKGHKVPLEISYGSRNGKAHAELIWTKANNGPSSEAIAAAKNADAVIAVVGITSQLEGEEMPVSEPGFVGGDRTSIDLPQPEEDLVETVAAGGKPIAVFSSMGVLWPSTGSTNMPTPSLRRGIPAKRAARRWLRPLAGKTIRPGVCQ